MIHHLSRAALNAAQMEMLGPNPGATLKAVLAALKSRVDVDSAIPPAEKGRVKEELTDDSQSSIGAAFRIANGTAMIPVSRTMADVAGTIRAVESMAKLGGAVISSLSDLGTATINLRFNGMSFGEAIRSQIKEFLQGRGKGEARELAYLLGEGFDGVLGRIISPYVANDGAPGAMQSVMATFFRWSGLSWWTDAQRAGAARILSAHLGRNAGKEFGALNARLQHVLTQHGITPEMWEVMRRYGVRKFDGRDYLTPEGLATVPDEVVLPLARDKVDAIEAGLADREAKRAAANAREAKWAETRLAKFREQVTRTSEWLADLREKMDEATSKRVAEVQARIGDMAERLTDVAEFLSALPKDGRSVARQQGRLRERLSRLQTEANRILDDLDKVPDQEARIAALEERLSELAEFDAATKHTMRALATERGRLSERVRAGRRALEGQAKAAASRLDAIDAQIADLTQRLDALEAVEVIPPAVVQAMGRLEGRLMRQIVEQEKRLRALTADTDKRFSALSDKARERLREAQAELLKFIESIKERAAEREAMTAAEREDMPQRIARVLDDTRRELELALRRYFADEAQSSVLEADAATQRVTTLGLSRGTLAGEAIRFVMQFKAFPIAFTQRVMGRAWQGGEGGKSAGVAHIGALIASTLVLGYAAMTVKDVIRGYAPKELVDEDGNPNWKTILAAAVQGGGAGIYGDFLFGEASRSGNTALENLAGPALSDLARWLTLYSRARDGDAKAGEALTAALSSTPFANLFYLRPALDYLILNSLRDYLSPGYLARQDQRRREQFGQDPLIAPSDRMAFDLF